MQALKCPACGHLISPRSQLSDGRISCPGCKKTFALRKKDPPAGGASAAPPQPAAVKASAPASSPAARPARTPVRPLSGLRKAAPRPLAVQEPSSGPETDLPHEEGTSGKPGIPPQKKVLMIAIPIVAVLCLGVVALLVGVQLRAAAEAQRTAADQVLQVVALKWLIEGEGVKECEAAWSDLRSEKNAAHLSKLLSYEPETRDLGLRHWMYEHRSQEQLDRITTFLSLLTNDSNQLLYLKATEARPAIHTEDVALDWLTSRGYRVLESLRKKGSASAPAGAKVDSTSPGGLNMSLFGTGLEASFDPSRSSIDLDAGVLRVAYRSIYPGLYNPQDASGAFEVSATIRQDRYILDLKGEIQEYLQGPGKWCSGSFEGGR